MLRMSIIEGLSLALVVLAAVMMVTITAAAVRSTEAFAQRARYPGHKGCWQ